MRAVFTKRPGIVVFQNPDDYWPEWSINVDDYEITFVPDEPEPEMILCQYAVRQDNLMGGTYQAYGLAGKPSALVHGTRDTDTGYAMSRIVAVSASPITVHAGPYVPTYNTSVGRKLAGTHTYEDRLDDWTNYTLLDLNCQFIAGDAFPAADDLTDNWKLACSTLVPSNMYTGDDIILQFALGSSSGSVPLTRSGVYSVGIASGAPPYYSPAVDRLVFGDIIGDCEYSNGGLAAATAEPRDGWVAIPSDENNLNASRYFSGVAGCPCGSQLPSNPSRVNRLGWAAGSNLFLTSGPPGSYGYFTGDKGAYLSVYSHQGSFEVILAHSMDCHVAVPSCRLVAMVEGGAVYEAFINGDGVSYSLKAKCYPGGEDVDISSGMCSWDGGGRATLDQSIVPDLSKLPATTTAAVLYLSVSLDYYSYPPDSKYAMVIASARTPYNPEQCTTWPEFTPGYARQVPIPPTP